MTQAGGEIAPGFVFQATMFLKPRSRSLISLVHSAQRNARRRQSQQPAKAQDTNDSLRLERQPSNSPATQGSVLPSLPDRLAITGAFDSLRNTAVQPQASLISPRTAWPTVQSGVTSSSVKIALID